KHLLQKIHLVTQDKTYIASASFKNLIKTNDLSNCKKAIVYFVMISFTVRFLVFFFKASDFFGTISE
ncbi:hypothetical protein, partial [Tenacibaculum finnmarkense]|uniref:hypothetical protein n=2 Tax=Tenacibaculum finnmarkense TaxID=2781243 RepID=UPI001EFA3DE3